MNIREYGEKYESAHSNKNQRILSKLVDREVIYSVSPLIHHFVTNPDMLEGSGYDEDDIYNLCESYDYEGAARDEGWHKTPNGIFYKEIVEPTYYLSVNLQERGLLAVSVHLQEYPEQGPDGPLVWEAAGHEEEYDFDLTDPDELREHLQEIGRFTKENDGAIFDNEECDWETSKAEDWQELCSEEGIDPDPGEIYEHWIVTPYFRRKLEDKGEVTTDDFFGMDIWGRGATGQAILLDSVIAEIAIDMEILSGMRNEWEV